MANAADCQAPPAPLDLDLAVALAAAMEGVGHAMVQAIAQGFLLDAIERGAHRANLRHRADAVTVRLNHPRDAMHPALMRMNRASWDMFNFSFMP